MNGASAVDTGFVRHPAIAVRMKAYGVGKRILLLDSV